MAVKIWTGEVLRLVQLLNEQHGEVTQAIMVKLELLLSSGHVHVAGIVNGSQMAVTTSKTGPIPLIMGPFTRREYPFYISEMRIMKTITVLEMNSKS